MKTILFVCTGNTCRSPMAEKIFNNICKERKLPYSAKSAGICTVTGFPMSENSFGVLAEMGIEDLDFSSTSIDEAKISGVDFFYVMSKDHRNVLINAFGIDGNKISVLNVSDPYGGSLERYRQCAQEIHSKIETVIDELGEDNGI